MPPKAIFINCGKTMCNVLSEYCRSNQICASCNEHVCNLMEHKDEFPQQCYFYCEKVMDKLKSLKEMGLAVKFGDSGIISLVVAVCLLVVVLCLVLCVALYRKRNNRKAPGKVEYSKLNDIDKNKNKKSDETNANTSDNVDLNVDNNKHAGDNRNKSATDNKDIHGSDSALSTDGSSQLSNSEDPLPVRTKNERLVKGTVSPQNDRFPGNEGQNQNKLVINSVDSEVMSHYQ